MIGRLIRAIVGIVTVFTLPLTIVPFIVIWILTDRFFLMDILDWVFGNEY
jgi:hypothetical protein